MTDTVRRRALYKKLDGDGNLNLDEQDEFMHYMREDLYKQRRTWRIVYTFLVGCIICGLIYGLCEDETGILPNVVRVMTIGDYSFSMATPCLLVCIVECLLTILFVLYPWVRMLIPISVAIPVVFTILWLVIDLTKGYHLGVPCLPLAFITFPMFAYSVEHGNRGLWADLDKLEEMRSKYKSV